VYGSLNMISIYNDEQDDMIRNIVSLPWKEMTITAAKIELYSNYTCLTITGLHYA